MSFAERRAQNINPKRNALFYLLFIAAHSESWHDEFVSNCFSFHFIRTNSMFRLPISNQITFELSLGAHTGVNRLFLFHVSFFQSAIQNLFTLLSVIRQKSTAKMDFALLFTHRKLFGKIGKNCRKTKIDQQNNPHKNYKEIVSKAHSTMMRIESCVWCLFYGETVV